MKYLKIILNEMKIWFFWWPFRIFAQHVPYKWSYCALSIVSWCIFSVSGKRKEKMMDILGRLLQMNDGKKLSKIVRRSFDLKIKNDLDVMLYPRINKENVQSVVSVEGTHHLDEALKKGRGAILLHCHFGNPQALMLGIGHLGYPLNQIGGNPVEDWQDLLGRPPTPLESRSLKLRLEYEKTLPVNFIYVFKNMRPVFRCLMGNEVLAVALDGGNDNIRTYVDLFHRTAFFASGPMKLALKTKAEVLPLFVVRKPDHQHTVVIEPPLKLDVTGDVEHDIQKNTQKYMSILERYVFRYPCHYVEPLVGELNYRFVDEEMEGGRRGELSVGENTP